jgi:hypothetical protein
METILFIVAVSVNSQSAPRLNVDAKEKIVKEGEQFEFVCRAGRPIEGCVIEFRNQRIGIKMRENIKKNDYEYLGGGYQRGDCGIRYFAIKPDHHGNVTCTVGFPDLDVESIGTTNLIVAIAPTAINLELRNEFRVGEEIRISCTAPGGRPASSVSLLLGNFLNFSIEVPIINFHETSVLKEG